jgi:hypothetical protein
VPVYNLGRDTNYSEVLVILYSPSGRMPINYIGIIIGHDHFLILSN